MTYNQNVLAQKNTFMARFARSAAVKFMPALFKSKISYLSVTVAIASSTTNS